MPGPRSTYAVAYRMCSYHAAYVLKFFKTEKEAERFYTKKNNLYYPDSIVLFHWERCSNPQELLTFTEDSKGYYWQYPNHLRATEVTKFSSNLKYYGPGNVNVLKIRLTPDYDGVYELWQA